jgi:hypothetical protein
VSSAAWLAPSPAPLRSPTERERARAGRRTVLGAVVGGGDLPAEVSILVLTTTKETRRRCSGSEAHAAEQRVFRGSRRTEVAACARGVFAVAAARGEAGWRIAGVGRDTDGGTAVAVREDAAGAGVVRACEG